MRFSRNSRRTLLAADVGVAASAFLIGRLRAEAKRAGYREPRELKAAMRAAMLELLEPIALPLDVSAHRPFIIMLAGVNGAGKTTSIGKLANHFQHSGKSVLLAAGDTFRAAAREQLQIWGERNNVAVITQQSGDAAAVIFDAVNAARARNIDVVLADTAGRLPTQLHLMEEINKVKRVIAKAAPGAPHEVLLVLDANTGQNAVNQVRAFDDALDVTGLILTKLDGTAKGGVICAIAHLRGAGARSRRSRCASSASAKASTICSRSMPGSSSMPCWVDRVRRRGSQDSAAFGLLTPHPDPRSRIHDFLQPRVETLPRRASRPCSTSAFRSTAARWSSSPATRAPARARCSN